MIDFTTFLAVDEQHLRELRKVWPTWMAHRPEILRQPLVVAIDSELALASNDLDFLQHPRMTTYPWNFRAPTQRAKMLSSFIILAPRVVGTPWILKLDTDLVAIGTNSGWCDDKLVVGNPVFVASPWGYTKPATAVKTLDDWGDGVPSLKQYSRLDLPVESGSSLVKTPGRIISWCFFGRTDWCDWASSLCGDNPPLYSHDTYLWYVAKRSKAFFATAKMKNFGWKHGKVL